MNVRHRPTVTPPDRHNWPKLKQILDEFQLCAPSVAGYYSHTLKKLKEDVPGWWRQFENGTDDQKNRIKDHIFLYLKMWDPTSGYSIRVNPQNLGSTILNDPTEGGVNIHDYSGMYKIFKRWSRWQRGNSFCYSTIVSSIAEMLYQ